MVAPIVRPRPPRVRFMAVHYYKAEFTDALVHTADTFKQCYADIYGATPAWRIVSSASRRDMYLVRIEAGPLSAADILWWYI